MFSGLQKFLNKNLIKGLPISPENHDDDTISHFEVKDLNSKATKQTNQDDQESSEEIETEENSQLVIENFAKIKPDGSLEI